MNQFGDVYRGRKVLVTGHTGFKGTWLTEWLCSLGAKVTGVALEPATEPAMFNQLQLASRIEHLTADVRDLEQMEKIVARVQPDFVFHLAAQPLVRLSYDIPVETYATNVMGTVHVLEALRKSPRPCVAVLITTDKCYENREWLHSYREEDPMGGYDPYSSSKAAAEIVISAYRRSFFNPASASPVKIASARAGNVIGGGDWALDRIVPDAMRALSRGESIPVRNPHATRPWQHVLEPLSGYLWLGAVLGKPSLLGRDDASVLCSAFNFGPGLDSNRSVRLLIEEILKNRPGKWDDRSNARAVHEASLLNLATDKAHHLLHWQPVWDFAETLAQTVRWYTSVERDADPLTLTREQIATFAQAAADRGIEWAKR